MTCYKAELMGILFRMKLILKLKLLIKTHEEEKKYIDLMLNKKEHKNAVILQCVLNILEI